ncbi:MAG: outer membrane lipoprotein carrier protein LolA [Treponema sp.]
MKKKLLFAVFIFSYNIAVFSQSITTAGVFFAGVSEQYGSLSDYTADITISTGTGSRQQTMNAQVYFKRPNRLRIDFSKPNEQVILFTGETLTIYVPAYRMVLSQTMEKDSAAASANIGTPQGLALLKRSYTIAYETGAAPQPLEEGSSEQAVVLALNRRSASETFRTIRLLVSPDTKLIRRIEAWPISGSKITFDFSRYRLNTGIPDSRFLYDIPPNADMMNNFLFEN